jgi:hypothetical protein
MTCISSTTQSHPLTTPRWPRAARQGLTFLRLTHTSHSVARRKGKPERVQAKRWRGCRAIHAFQSPVPAAARAGRGEMWSDHIRRGPLPVLLLIRSEAATGEADRRRLDRPPGSIAIIPNHIGGNPPFPPHRALVLVHGPSSADEHGGHGGPAWSPATFDLMPTNLGLEAVHAWDGRGC